MKKYVCRKFLPVYFMGIYTDRDGRKYRAYRPSVLTLSEWFRLEPLDGGRAHFAYNAGNPIGKRIAIDDNFTRSYIECALWSSMDESTPQGGEPST